ncbi:PTS mannitol transporter subunit IIA [Aerococcus agrisoli]|uniref:Mannitol-specific phosphotransferase enzyme IIA component n=1 Tax=Aerococcus agrisoli TaxID=2487350 RepID=A0A3N4GEZ4_9LACT|nr:PTS sugar transporter subunit IIA [Aerococcus agrisoli]RPA60458.1 PTS mannitol transporter subunit IIA [Aerococcus agrisoli]
MELKQELIQLNASFTSKEEAIRAAGALLVQAGAVDADYVLSMLERESIVSTYMGNFVAIPHGTDGSKAHVKQTAISYVQVPQGVDFSDDESEEKLATAIFGIAGVGDDHLDLLSKIAIFCSDVSNVVRLTDAKSEAEIIEMLKEVEA